MSEPQVQPADFRSLLKQGLHLLREARVPSHTLAAELLLLHATGRDRTWLYAHPEERVAEPAAQKFLQLIQRRIAGEPTQHLTGHQEFWGLDFEVTPDVLIPRPETEHLIEVALDRLAVREIRAGRPPKLTGENVSIVDIGTGSGCIAIALAKELPVAQVFATDISSAALAVAQRNARRLGFYERITFLESGLFDAFSPLTTRHSLALCEAEGPLFFDLVISNPPYIAAREKAALPIEVRDHEPPAALYGGEEGYELYGSLIPEAARHLKPSGLLVLELGHDSLPAVRPLLEIPEWTNLLVTNDLAGIPRVLSAERTST
jgi:release factor glutamine methyltransferase